ncbi:hypothetical protein SEA_KLEVEY_62 [Arthrobacter phage Klevey]|uniref:Uncharacterized protein n=1 Tax=Arthrobacter phage Klevey TaxID=2867481 RepID=A0AAE9BRL2_9CAUD|nr:hypothetical protein SEA_KLEVEY_62 [Arthrobacter phage Klevey]
MSRYVVVSLERNLAALCRVHDSEDPLVYDQIATGPSSLILSDIAETLNEAEARREAEAEAAKVAEASEPREVQLDAMVIHQEQERHPELHADRRPDSYGRTAEPAEDRTRRAIGFGRALPLR